MEISVSDAKGRLTDLVRRAEAGEDVVLTRHGRPAAKLVAIPLVVKDPAQRRAIIREIQKRAKAKMFPGPPAARSQDFLYDDETGLPA